MDAVYYVTGILTVVGLPVIGLATLLYFIKPSLLNKSKRINNPVSRKKVAMIGVMAFFLSTFAFSGVMAATEPMEVKQARIAEEKAAEEKKLSEIKDLEEARLEGIARQKEIEASKPVIKAEQIIEAVPYESTTKETATLPKGTTQVSVKGVNGERTITFNVTYVKDAETQRKQVKSEVTTAPINEVTLVGTYVAPAPPKPSSACDPNYSGACVPIASDVDCGGGSGNGPAYVYSTVTVIGTDIYGLDRDGDGYGCE